jgi:hypothetical protein
LPAKKKEGKIIARVYDQYLYVSDLADLVPKGTTPGDSAELTGNFVNNWIRQELLLSQAQDNLSDEQMDFGKQVEQYRNSLVIFQYESELVRQKLDTSLTMKEIQEYYEKNRSNFLLHENILKVTYASFRKDSPLSAKVRQLIRSDRQADKDKLIELCQESAEKHMLDDQNWISFAEFARQVPVTVSDQSDFLSRNPYFEVQDSLSRYFVRIREYKIKESISPLNFEMNNIKAILLNKRKSELISRMEEDLYNEALKKKNFEIYK